MSALRKLASQTAYYGISSILGRMLNYALVPLHTRVLTQQMDYGIVGEMYAYVAILNIIYLYGMETAFFRFSSKTNDLKTYYSTSFSAVFFSSIIFSGIMIACAPLILTFLSVGEQALYRIDYVIYFALILGLDAISAIPFSRLRLQNRPLKFAAIKIINITINVLLNVFFLWICPAVLKNNPHHFIASFFDPDYLVGYIFLSNLIASAFTLLLLYKEIAEVKLKIDWKQLNPMLIYGFPLMLAGIGGMMNEMLGRISLKYLLPGTLEERLAALGVYNAVYKLSIFMTLAIQAFRMASEPFFFSMHKESNAKDIYSRVMNYFVIVCCAIFLGVMLNIDILQILIGDLYREGLIVVPVLLMANLFLGIYLNLSIWYKLTDKTMYGTYFTFIGAFITIVLNFLWIPVYGYTGSAYATLICYFTMALLCYLIGQRIYHVSYNLKKIVTYLLLTLGIYFLSSYIKYLFFGINSVAAQVINSLLFLSFIAIVYLAELSGLRRNADQNN